MDLSRATTSINNRSDAKCSLCGRAIELRETKWRFNLKVGNGTGRSCVLHWCSKCNRYREATVPIAVQKFKEGLHARRDAQE